MFYLCPCSDLLLNQYFRLDSINEHATLFAHEPVKIKRCIVRDFQEKDMKRNILSLLADNLLRQIYQHVIVVVEGIGGAFPIICVNACF